MKTLLQITTFCNRTSPGRIAEMIGQKALSQGWNSYIASGRKGFPSTSREIHIGGPFSVAVHGIGSRILDAQGLYSRKATIDFIHKVESIAPDIVHLHNIHGYYLNYPLLFDYLSSSGVPVVWTLHDCWPFTGHCAYFDRIGCERWKTHCQDCPQKGSYPKSLFVDSSSRNFSLKEEYFTKVKNMVLVPVSFWLATQLKESFLRDYPLRTIHNGVDTDVFAPSEESVKDLYGLSDKFVILGVASPWTPRKGLEDFMVLSDILPQWARIVLVGLSEDQMKSLPKNIMAFARTDNAGQLSRLYSMADVFLNCTYEDNFPTTSLEALSCGTPVITYNTGGCSEAVSEDTGFVVSQGDLEEVMGAVRSVHDRGKAAYSPSCRQRVLDYFRKDDRYEEYMRLYDSLVSH